MAKPIIDYTIRTQRDPVNGTTIHVPTIVNRGDRTVTFAKVVEHAIDRGRIVAVKASAAEGLANGLITQMSEEFREGNNVQVGPFFYGRLYLDGTVSGPAGQIGASNNVNVKLIQGSGLRLRTEDFSWHLVGAEAGPRIDFVLTNDSGAVRGRVERGKPIAVNGSALAGATGMFAWKVGESDRAAAASVTANGENLLVIDWPDELDDAPSGTEVSLTLTTHAADGSPLTATATFRLA